MQCHVVGERHGPLLFQQSSQSSGETVAVVTVLVGVLVGELKAVAVAVLVAVGLPHRKYPVGHVLKCAYGMQCHVVGERHGPLLFQQSSQSSGETVAVVVVVMAVHLVKPVGQVPVSLSANSLHNFCGFWQLPSQPNKQFSHGTNTVVV